MLRNTYILVGGFCITALMQSASNDAQAVVGQSQPAKSQLEDCFVRETLLMTGPSRCYVPFVADVEIGKFTQASSFPGLTYRPAEIMAGVAGIVEGRDAELVEEVAKSVKHLLTVSGIRLDETGLPQDLKKRNKQCLKEALRKVIAGDFDRHTRASDIACKVVWFHEHSSQEYLLEFGERKRTGADLRKILVPAGTEKQLKDLELCYTSPHFTQEARLEVLDRFVKKTQEAQQETHEATILRFDLNRYLQLSK